RTHPEEGGTGQGESRGTGGVKEGRAHRHFFRAALAHLSETRGYQDKRELRTKSYRNMGARRRSREGVTVRAIAAGILALCSASIVTGTGTTSVRAREDASF
ncbi:unnamed protein product, partial [Ectocarpus sp. 6 AP-2014]